MLIRHGASGEVCCSMGSWQQLEQAKNKRLRDHQFPFSTQSKGNYLLSCNLIENIKHPDLDLGTFLIQTGFTTSLRFLPVLYDLISPTQPPNSITENRPQSMPHRRENIQDPEQGLSLPAPRRTRKLCILGGIFSLILLVIVIVAVLYFLGIF